MPCLPGTFCNPADGACTDDMCVGMVCPASLVCDQLTGSCEADPCDLLNCPAGEICMDGECAIDTITPGDGGPGGMDGGPGSDAGEPIASGTRVLATGGGGCACSVPGSQVAGVPSGHSNGAGWAFFVGLFALLAFRRRRRPLGLPRRALVALLGAAVLALLVSGCDVEPFCIDCVEAPDVDAGPADGSANDSATDGDTPDSGDNDANIVDANIPDGCTEGAPEICNDFDDDCDGMVDEGVDTDTDPSNCGSCGNACSPANAFAICTARRVQLYGLSHRVLRSERRSLGRMRVPLHRHGDGRPAVRPA